MLFHTSAPNGGQYPMVEVKGRPLGSDEDWYEPGGGSWAWNVFGVAFRARTYKHLAFLFIAAPLGALYFSLMVAFLSAGSGLAVVLVGIPLLLGVLYAVPVLAEVERHLSNALLGTRIRRMRFEEPNGPGAWEHILSRLRSTASWQSMAYVVIKLPLSAIGFSLMMAFMAAALAPLSVPFVAIWDVVDFGIWRVETWQEGLIPVLLTPVVLLLALHIVNGTAWVTARITEGMLQPWSTPSPRRARPAAAKPTPVVAPAERVAEAPAAQDIEPRTGVHETAAEAAEPATPSSKQPTGSAPGEAPLGERARRTAATITDRLQAVTDELGERARAAARGWSAAGPGTATAESVEAASPTTDAVKPVASEPETTDDTNNEDDRNDGGEDSGPARVTVDVVMRVVTVNEEEIELTPKEFDLIVLFVSNPGRPFSRDELLDRIWKNDYEVTDRTIDTHIQRLRKKLGPAAELIQTIWGVGYKYQPPRD